MRQVVSKFPSVSIAYFNVLAESADRLSDNPIINPDIQHAEAALVFLYTKAISNIQILDDFIENDVTPISLKLKEKWEKVVLNKDIKIEAILVDSDTESYQVNFLKDHLGEYFNNYIYPLKKSRFDFLTETTKDKKPFKFTLVDESSFRLEYDVKNHQGYLNFNDVKTSDVLNTCFYQLYQSPV